MASDRYSLKGKVAIVTGGGTGLGKVISLALARAGADLMIAARRPELINETAAEVIKLGQKAMAVPTDVTDSKQVNYLIEKTLTQFGRIDILLSNAGIVRGVELSRENSEILRRIPSSHFPQLWVPLLFPPAVGEDMICVLPPVIFSPSLNTSRRLHNQGGRYFPLEKSDST